MQIIVGAMAFGVLMFAVATLVIPGGGQGSQFLSHIAFGSAFLALVFAAALPPIILGQQRKAVATGAAQGAKAAASSTASTAEFGDIAPLAVAFQTCLIIRVAILEGAAFFNLTAFLIEKQWLNLITAGGLLLFILSQLPRASQLENWLEDEQRAVNELRQMEPRDVQ